MKKVSISGGQQSALTALKPPAVRGALEPSIDRNVPAAWSFVKGSFKRMLPKPATTIFSSISVSLAMTSSWPTKKQDCNETSRDVSPAFASLVITDLHSTPSSSAAAVDPVSDAPASTALGAGGAGASAAAADPAPASSALGAGAGAAGAGATGESAGAGAAGAGAAGAGAGESAGAGASGAGAAGTGAGAAQVSSPNPFLLLPL